MEGCLVGWTAFWVCVYALICQVSSVNGGLDYSGDGCGALLGEDLVQVSPSIFHVTSGKFEPSGSPLLNSKNVWCAGIVNSDQFITVNLGKVVTIDKVVVGGKKGTTQCVSQYYVYTSEDGKNFYPIYEPHGPVKAFRGTKGDGNAENPTSFTPIRASHVKFNPREPLKPTTAPHNLCMRIEIYGCTNDNGPVDGGWTTWQQWSDCSKSCYGTKTRERYCTNPAPRNGGKACAGHSSETQLCVYGCGVQIDGQWSSWGTWGACSKSCGVGQRRRKRACTNPAPANGGDPCFGPSAETEDCNAQGCSVDGAWSDWAAWSSCSNPCGGGNKMRTRKCNNPAPAHGGKACPGANVETHNCNTHNCPVNGGWSAWSAKSQCDKDCGGGQRYQTRTCTNPQPAYGGSQCAGDVKITEQCNTQPCPINGGWSYWSAWSDCSKPCGGGERQKTRACTNPLPQYGGLNCQGSDRMIEACGTQPCPVDGGISDWAQWSSCTKNCDGTRSRSRSCTKPPPAHGGKLCTEHTSETEKCGGACPVAVDGGWSVWSDWGACSVTCGADGTQDRTRTCTNPPPANGGSSCTGVIRDTQACKVVNCPVDGDWSSWGNWGQCSKTCGNGVHHRYRTCTNPAPAYNGANCVGDKQHTRDCTVRACKVDGRFSDWSSWSDCTKKCGGGSKTRSRSCDNPPPQNGGADCSGPTSETVKCNDAPCDVDGGWSSWRTFSSCSVRCGGGTKTRIRTCNNPSRVGNGAPCTGDSVDRQSCNTQTCKEDGQWASWGTWAKCSKTCGQGSKTRLRSCTNPPPQGGGKDCTGDSRQSSLCSFRPCPAEPTPTEEPTPDIPDIDLLFVMSATSVDADRTFDLIKDAINSIVTKYGIAKIHYAAVVVGKIATVHFDFRTHFPDRETLKKAVASLPRYVEGPNLDLGLEEAKRVFRGSAARLHAKKVLVVITDEGSSAKPKTLLYLAEQLEFIDVKIITVGIGTTVDVDQLVNITTRGTENHLSVNNSVTPVVLGVKIMELVLKENVPEIDLAFALSATSATSGDTYALMKKTIKAIITRYGIDKIHYSFIVFANTATIKVDFGKTFPSKDALKQALDGIPKENGATGLDKALEQAKALFESNDVRPNAKKVLVTLMDEASNIADAALVKKVRPLEDKGVLVISVGIGSEVKAAELRVISPNPQDVILVSKDEPPTQLAVEIMERVLRVNIPEVDLAFALSADSASSEKAFALMKSIIKAIIDRYGTTKLDFSVIVYGRVPTTNFNFGTKFPDKASLKRSVDALPKREGPVNLEKALTEAHKLFTNTPTRPNAKKILVVVTDVQSETSKSSLQLMSRNLRKSDIRIVSVAMGGEGIVGQLKDVSLSDDDVISVPNHEEKRPVVLAEEIMLKVFLANVPEIDLTFAISATATNADETFTLMKDTVESIVQTYGILKIHYSVILFRSVATTHVDFSKTFPNKEALVKIVERLPKMTATGGPALDSALREAKKVYEQTETRENARKVLVVILDNASSSSTTSLDGLAEELRDQKVFIVGVGIGKVDEGELQVITNHEDAVIRVAPDHQPDDLAKKIMLAILSADGFSSWRDWGECSKTCRYLGVPGQQKRTRQCVYPELSCIGPEAQQRACNEQDCDDCGEVRPLPVTAYTASSLSQQRKASDGRLKASNAEQSQAAWCAGPEDSSSYLQINLGGDYDVYGLVTKGKSDSPQSWVTQYRLRNSADAEEWTYYQEEDEAKVFQGNSDARNLKYNLFEAEKSVRHVRVEPISWAPQQKGRACIKVAVLACRGLGPPVIGKIDGGHANTAILVALWILAGVLTFLLLLALLWFCCWYYCCGGKDRKRRRQPPATLAAVGGGEGYLLDTMDGSRKWMLGPKILTHQGIGLPEDEVQEVSVEMGREYSEKPQGVIQFAVDAGVEPKPESKFSTTTSADQIRSQIPVYSSDGTIRSGVSMSSLDGGYSSVDRRERAAREKGAVAADGPGNWGYMTADRRRGGYSTVAEQYAPGYATIGTGYVNGQRYRYVPEYTPSGHATVGAGGFHDSGFSNAAYVGSREYVFERHASQRRKSESDVLDSGLGEHEVTFTTDLVRGGKTTETSANGGYHTEEWYVRGRGPSTEEGYQEVQVEQQAIYSEVRKSNKNQFGHSRLI